VTESIIGKLRDGVEDIGANCGVFESVFFKSVLSATGKDVDTLWKTGT
jgi:hypothetical protein